MTGLDDEPKLMREQAGPPLPNSFDDEFARLLACKVKPEDAFIAAGYLHTPGYQESAAQLAKRPDIVTRVAQYSHALDILAIKYGAQLRAQAEKKKAPPDNPDDVPSC